MPDAKISALPVVAGSLADADVLAILNGGSTKKVTLSQLTAYFESRARQTNASVTNQTPAAATDVYLLGSDVTIPTGRLQAKSMYRLKFDIVKTAAGVAAPILNIRIGTAGTVADASRGVHTFAVQTAVADEGAIDLNVVFRTVGSGTTAVVQSMAMLDHRLAATGLSIVNTSITKATSAGFDSTTAGLKIGCSINTGAAAAWTISLVQAELMNLA